MTLYPEDYGGPRFRLMWSQGEGGEGILRAFYSGWSGDYALSRLNSAHKEVLDQPADVGPKQCSVVLSSPREQILEVDYGIERTF